ncbi:MAG: hypothetical protein CVV64_08145 [Candidatus Wallbacteria bacterium HGW-Wallbacteria-1]|jgi:ABC-type uncharacterized transport system involved in gliding motility auxiliary subunit|uniref:Uncharacterized protein n=1 Tax=Candidatus Wallbacteria bacterium HGW-Wallbacteria-1 TaxID=2013854 RepID=A0A2N1PR67_9BACT|nr:MAG: hypothetical protein CVV64_08145 [Candidatus Wallbacteria bacterium HGW-Wallbacteria-1]
MDRRKEKFRIGFNVFSMVLLTILLCAMVNYLSFRHHGRIDLTASREYSVGDSTKAVLRSLTSDLKIIVFLLPDDVLYDAATELLKGYAAVSSKVSLEIIDADRDKARADILVKQFGIKSANVVVFQIGERSKYVTRNEMAEFEYLQPGAAQSIKKLMAEQSFTSAIMSLSDERQTRVSFLQGHGEPALDTHSKAGIGKFVKLLKRENFNVDTFHSLGKSSVPVDCDLLIVFSPQTTFLEEEVRIFRDFIDAGGRILLFMDPVFENKMDGFKRTGIEKMILERTGISMGEDIVLDPSHKLAFVGPQTIFVQRFGVHPVTDKMAETPVILSLARSVTDAPVQHDDKVENDSGASASKIVASIGRRYTLMMTSDEGWGETSMNEIRSSRVSKTENIDLMGPVSLAVAWESDARSSLSGDQTNKNDSQKPSRMVIFGSSSFALDSQLDSSSHIDLLLNTVRWLTYKDSLISITPRTIENSRLSLNDDQMGNLTRIIMLGIPFICIVMGFLVYLARRS